MLKKDLYKRRIYVKEGSMNENDQWIHECKLWRKKSRSDRILWMISSMDNFDL